MGCCESASAPPAAGPTVAVALDAAAELAHGSRDVAACAPAASDGTVTPPRLPAPEELAGEWCCAETGVELTLAPRTHGSLQYATSASQVALLHPQSSAYAGHELYWNTGSARKVELCPHGNELERRLWDVDTGRRFAPSVFRRLSAAEAATRGRFVALATLWEALAAGHTVLLKGSWLLHAAAPLPRRQDLPRDAAWEKAELQCAVEAGTVRIVALSYCWKEQDHPDLHGEQLRTVAALIERRLAYAFPDGTRVLEDLAVFWDYASLFQKPRSAPEQDAFDWGLQEVDLWYAHNSTETWLLTRAPQGTKAYNDRGWPVFERAVCGLITPADSFLDIGLWEGGNEGWAQVAKRCRAQREPPLHPAQAAALLKTKHFTSGADFEKVRRIYERTYYQVLCGVRTLNFTNLKSWGDREAEVLADCLADCPQLEELALSYDRIGPAGAAALGAAAAKCSRLRALYMVKNPLGDAGAAALLTGLARCPALERLFLTETGMGDHGAEAVAVALPRCRALRALFLDHCRISDAGAAALGAAAAQCVALEQLEINDNQLSAGGKAALKNAWASAGKQRTRCLV